MHISVRKSFTLAILMLVSAHQSEAFLIEHAKKAGEEQLTCGGMFRNWVVHTAVREWAKDNLPDSLLLEVGTAQLHAHEVWQTIASMVVEYMYQSSFAVDGKPENAAKLVAYGAVMHKVIEEIWYSLGLHTYFSDKVKDNYSKFGKSYCQYVFALQLQQKLNDLKVPGA